MSKLRIIVVCLTVLGLSYFTNPVEATATAPTIVMVPTTITATSTSYAVVLINLTAEAFNVIELELQFTNPTNVAIGSITSDLCRPELTVANTLETATGQWYLACGTYIPFSGTIATLATFTITNQSNHNVIFGSNTSLYRHDGLGTQVVPNTIGIGNIKDTDPLPTT